MDTKPLSALSVEDLIMILQKRGVIVMPTETAYGLIADSTDSQAVERVYRIKGRSYQKPLPVVCASLRQVKKFFVLNKEQERIIQSFWPGPLTIILPVKQGVEIFANTAQSPVAVRVTSNGFLSDLAQELDKPLIATSANLSGRKTLYKQDDIVAEFKKAKNQPDLIVLAGDLPEVSPSTIIELSDGRIKVLRSGPIKFSD